MKFIFRPITIKKVTIPNRIGMPSMHLNFTPEGFVTDKIVHFYKERAKGGVGLIVVGGCSINDTAGGGLLVGLHDDKFIEGLKRLTDTVHSVSDTKIAAQLYHAGRYASSFLIGKQPVAPSAIPSKLTKETPKELTIDEIHQIEDDFAKAAYRAKQAGFDAVEILSSAGYLIPQFLSPLTNKRQDEYGGSFENRVRFAVEVIRKVREAVGDDFPIMTRFGGSDFVRNSNTSKDMLEVAKVFAKEGIDLFNVTGGWHETHVPQIAGAVPIAAFAYLAAGVKKATSKPVIISNRIQTLDTAEQLLRDGWGDMVNFARPLIADPYLVNKAKNSENVRPCIACNQKCFDAIFTGKEVGCTVNPFVAKEKDFPDEELKKTDSAKKLVVLGAGPAGLSFAITAAKMGHNVVVFEKSNKIGGQLIIASAPQDKRDFAKLIDYYAREIEKLNIKVVLSKSPTVDDILKEKPDGVVLAGGGKPIIPNIEGVDKDNVYLAKDILNGTAPIKDKIVIIGGGAVGVDVARYIVDHSQINGETAKFLLEWEAEDCDRVKELFRTFKDITIIEMLNEIGKDIGKTTRWISLKGLALAGVKMLTNTKAKKIEDDGVIVESENGQTKIEAQQVILAVGYKPNDEMLKLSEELKNRGVNIYTIGDAKKVRKLPDAIEDGFKLALNI